MIGDYQRKFGFTGVIVSHEIPEIFFITQRVAMLDAGRILFEGTPEEILECGEPRVREFVLGIESRHDELTGMTPLTQGIRRFQQERARLQRHESTFSLIILTIDNMEEINKRLGHERGQALLRNFAESVQRHLRITDSCSRYGMDKIMVLLPKTNIEQSRQLCEKLSREMSGNEIATVKPGIDFCFSISAGLAEAEKDSRLEQVVSRAEANQSTIFQFTVC
jgi:phospholipid/cholesterol/gamma-HCH transport system ATP-binding protein